MAEASTGAAATPVERATITDWLSQKTKPAGGVAAMTRVTAEAPARAAV